MTVKDLHLLGGELQHLSQSRQDQDGVTPHSHSVKLRMALLVAGEILCLPVVPRMGVPHPGDQRTSHPAGTMA